MPKFIYDSYACRKGKGVHCAVNRLQGFIRNLGGRNKPLYYLQLDIESFFINIDKNILYGLIRSKTRQQNLLWLAREIIFHNPADNYDSYRLQQSVIKRHDWLAEFFSLDDSESGTIKPRARFLHPQIWRNIAEQYGYYRHIFLGAVLLFQVGAYFEFYDIPSVPVLELLQLQPLAANHRRALYGFPLRLEDYYCRRLLMAGFTPVVIKQSDIIIQRLHQRLPQYKLIYNHQGVHYEDKIN